MSERVLDVGAGKDPDPRATESADLHDLAGVDHQFDIRDQWPFDDAALDGIVMSHVLEHVADQSSVLAEAARCLRVGGWLEVTVPVGDDAYADPDHEHVWTYATPELLARDGRTRHWDETVPLKLADRSVNAWLFPPFAWCSPVVQLFADHFPAEAVRRCSSGEIVATYRRDLR